MDSKGQNGKRALVGIGITIGVYLFLTGVAFFRRSGGLHFGFYVLALVLLLGSLFFWNHLRPKGESFVRPLNLSGVFALSLLLLWCGSSTWSEWQWRKGETQRRKSFEREFQFLQASSKWIRLKGFPEPVGLEISVSVDSPELPDFQAWANVPRIALTRIEVVPSLWENKHYHSTQIFQSAFLKSNRPKTENPPLRKGKNVFLFKLYPSYLTEVEDNRFCINTVGSSIADTKTQLPEIEEGTHLYAAWNFGNQFNAGLALTEALQGLDQSKLRESFKQFNILLKSSFHPCGTNPKRSSICYCAAS